MMKTIPEFRGYIFDMGNTLLDFHQGSSDAEKDSVGVERLALHLEETYGLIITDQYLEREFLNLWLSDFPLRERGRELDVSLYLNRSLEPFQLELTPIQCVRAMQVWFSEYRNQVFIHPHAETILQALHNKGKMVGIVSNCTLYGEIFEDIFASVGLAKYIKYFSFSYSQGVRKPHAMLYQKALEGMGLDPAETVMIGDRIDTDLWGAYQLGISTIWYNPRKKVLQGKFSPDHEITDFREILERVALG